MDEYQKSILIGLTTCAKACTFANTNLSKDDFVAEYQDIFLRVIEAHKNKKTIQPSLMDEFLTEKQYKRYRVLFTEATTETAGLYDYDTVIELIINYKTELLQTKLSLGVMTAKEFAKQINKLVAPKVKDVKLDALAEQRILEREMEKTAPSTGFPELDDLIAGFLPSRLYTLTGNTNVGKTAVSCNFTVNILNNGGSVLYFALEPDSRLLDYLASVAFEKKYEDVTDDDIRAIAKSTRLTIATKQGIQTVDDLIEFIEDAPRYDLIVIDHIGYFVTDEAKNLYQKQSDIIKKMVQLAIKKRTAIIQIAHPKKPQNAKDNWQPTMFDIAGTAAFYQDATDVLIVTKDSEDSDIGTIKVSKTKAKRTGSMAIIFEKGSAKLKSLSEVNRTNEDKKEALKHQLKVKDWGDGN